MSPCFLYFHLYTACFAYGCIFYILGMRWKHFKCSSPFDGTILKLTCYLNKSWANEFSSTSGAVCTLFDSIIYTEKYTMALRITIKWLLEYLELVFVAPCWLIGTTMLFYSVFISAWPPHWEEEYFWKEKKNWLAFKELWKV